MLQVGRSVTDSESGALHGKRYLILDRDTKYTNRFRTLVRDSGLSDYHLVPPI